MNLKVGIGEETRAGEKATTITQLRATESDLKPAFNKVDSEDYNGSAYKGDSFVATAGASGSISMHLTVESLKLLLGAIGYKLESGTGDITEQGITIENIAKCNTSGKIEKTYTFIEQNLEDSEERILTGCQINNISFEAAQGAYIKVTLDIVGEKYEYAQSLSSITPLTDYDKRLTCIDTNFKLGSDVSANTQSVNISLNNNLEAKYGLGSINATRIARNGKIEAKADLTFNTYDKALYKKAYDNLVKGETAEASLTFKTKDDKFIGIYLHKLGTNSVEMTDKNASGGLTQELDIQYSSEKSTPITFAIGKKQED